MLSGLCFAWLTLFLRRQKDGSALPSLLLGNLLAGMIGLPFMFQSMPDASSWIGLILLGVVQLGLPYILYALALRHVMAVEGHFDPDDRTGAESGLGVPDDGRAAESVGYRRWGDHSGRGGGSGATVTFWMGYWRRRMINRG